MGDSHAIAATPAKRRHTARDGESRSGEAHYASEFARRHRVLHLRETSDHVVVGVCEPPSDELRSLLETFHRKRVLFSPMPYSELTTELAKTALSETPLTPDSAIAHRARLDRLANEAPVVNLVDSLLLRAIDAGASDVHVESTGGCFAVRFRIDGRLTVVERLAASLFPAVATRIKLIAGLNIMERRLPQDGRVTVVLHGSSADVRVSTVPTREGESIVVRIFPTGGTGSTLEELGFSRSDAVALRSAALRTAGLLLTTGPTGSGKSTTLAALLRLLATEEQKVITIEDPVEQILPGVIQLQTDDRIGLSFDRLLRHVLRQDPNVVMVGEIRDAATCELAVRASLTGHLILSTLHTNGAVAAVDRLRNLGAPAYLLAEVLQASLAQRLVRRPCSRCAATTTIPRELSRRLDGQTLRRARPVRPVGCDACKGSGYRGRIPLLELFIPNDRQREMIAEGQPALRIAASRRDAGRRTLLRDGLIKVAMGLTTMEELRTAIEVPW